LTIEKNRSKPWTVKKIGEKVLSTPKQYLYIY
jgi:hypothetical protein